MYYKNSPYRKGKGGKGYECCERLDEPGYRISLLYIDGIGYMLPAICRDVIDGRYTDYLVSKFHPTLIMISAWSTSGRTFIQPLQGYAANYFSNSVFCNGCGALSANATIMGGIMILEKKETVTDGQFYSIKKPSNDRIKKDCENFCTFLFELDFSPENLGQTNRIMEQPL